MSSSAVGEPLRVKLIGCAFWAIASPFLLYVIVEIVGKTVEHFTP